MPKYTEGPWELKSHGAIAGGKMRELVGGWVRPQVAMACSVDDGGEVQEANARLISAAPELVEALQALMASAEIEDGKWTLGDQLALSKRYAKAEAALRKAGVL